LCVYKNIKQRPDLLKESGLEWEDLVNDFTRLERLEWAFTKADVIGIPRLLDPEDVDEERPDSKIIMTYVSGMLRFFQDEDGSSAESQIDRPTGSFASSIDELIGGSSKKQASTSTSAKQALPTLKTTPPVGGGANPSPSPRKDVPVEKQLENLEKMYQKGLINQESYEKSKLKIMEKVKEQQAQLSARSDRSSNSDSSAASSNTGDANGAQSDKTQKALANLQKLYEKGTLSEEEYKKAVEKLKSKSVPSSTTPATTSTASTSTTSDEIDTSKFTADQLKKYENLKKMLNNGVLSEDAYQKSLSKIMETVNKPAVSTPTKETPKETPTTPKVEKKESPATPKSSVPLDKIQDQKKLSNLKTLLNKGVITEEEFEKAVQKLYQQQQEETQPAQTATTPEFTTDIDVDSIRDEDMDEKTRGRVKAIDRMYKAGLFKDYEYQHSRRKVILQGLQEAGG